MFAWRGLPIVMTAVLGVTAAIGAFLMSASWEARITRIDFENRAAAQLALVNADLRDAVSVLDTVRAYVEASDTPVTGQEFLRFARVLHGRTVGLRDLGWAPHVTAEARERFERAARTAEQPDFAIRELDASGAPVRAADRADYYPVLYVDAGVAKNPVVGLDLTFEPRRRATIGRAIASGQAVATPAMALLTVPRPRGGVMSYVPAFRAADAGGLGGRSIAGLVFGAFDISAMIEHLVAAKRRLTGIDIYLYDPAAPLGDRLIYWRSGSERLEPPPDERVLRALPHWDGTVAMIDQRWGALFLPTAGLDARPWHPAALVPPAVALLLTSMVIAYLAISLRRTQQLEALAAQLRETTEGLHRQAEQTTHLARYDALTDLPNRLTFHEAMRLAAARAARGTDFAMLSLDLDRFKQVNDTLGHPVGDALLCAVADRLRGMVRATDTVARLGGDEFAIVQTDIGGPDDASLLAQRIIDHLSAPYDVVGHRVVIGASVGIALGHAGARDVDTLLRNGDLALYRAKQEGRGAFRFFEPDMDARAQARRHLEMELRAALERDEFELFYQPLISVRDRRIAAFEALIRWRHPSRGLVPPDSFIPLAEEIGLIVPLGGWVLHTACREAAGWPDGIGVAVNISPVQFSRGDVLGQVTAALRDSGLPASRLEVEITETALLHDGAATLATLQGLRARGVSISMDDFGTGYSSLSYLRSFPFDKLKIDRSFIRDLGGTGESAAIVRAIAGMGHSLGIATIAEGVETEEQMRQLVGDGCTELQGYFFSRPCPASEVAALLRDPMARRVA